MSQLSHIIEDAVATITLHHRTAALRCGGRHPPRDPERSLDPITIIALA